MKFDKINIDRSSLSAEDIAKGKSFEGLMNAYNGVSAMKPWYKSSAFFTTLGVAAAAVILTALVISNNTEISESNTQSDTQPNVELTNDISGTEKAGPQATIAKVNDEDSLVHSAIKPPFGDIIDRNEFKVDAEKGGVFNIQNSKLTIPKNTFVHADGSAVIGEVDMEFTEYHDKADLLISGIPMDWKENGEDMQFETGGMIEVRASQDGEEVYMAQNKSIEVEMQTQEPTKSSSFNEYFFNEETALWEEIGPMKREAVAIAGAADSVDTYQYAEIVEIPLERDEQLEVIEEKIVEHKKTEPSEPKVLSADAVQIELDFNEDEFPELAGYKGVLWEVEPDRLDASQSQKEWTDVAIKKGLNGGAYMVTFKKPGDRYVVQCNPVVSEADKATSKATFEKKYTQYKEKLVELELEEAAERKRLAAERVSRREQAKLQRAQFAEAQAALGERFVNEGYLLNYFSVRRFGVYNCDNPQVIPNDVKYSNPRFFVDGKESSSISTVYLVVGDANAVFSLYQYYGLSYSPKTNNAFITVLSDGYIAMTVNEGIKKVNSSTCDVQMTKFNRKIKSKQDVLAIMDSAEEMFN